VITSEGKKYIINESLICVHIRDETIYHATINRNAQIQQWVSWIVTIRIVDSPTKIKKNTV